MSFSSIARAAADQQLIDRVSAAAHQAIMDDPDKASTVLGQALLNPVFGSNPVVALMWPVATDTEAEYESALLSGNGSPGFDVAVISDDAIKESVVAHWPMTYPPGSATPTMAQMMAASAPDPTVPGPPVNMPPDLPVQQPAPDTPV